MSLKRRQFSREFKQQIVREVESGKSVAEVARENEINPLTISRWRKEQREYSGKAFSGHGVTYKYEARIAELERKIGQMAMENDLLKKVLTRLKMLEQPVRKTGRG